MTDSTDATPVWPKTPPTAAEMRRYLVARGLWLNRAAWELVPAEPGTHAFTIYMGWTVEMIDCHDEYLLLGALLDADPVAADDAARRMWTAAEDGGSYGEWLWQWARDEGLDQEAISAAGAAVGRMAEREGNR